MSLEEGKILSSDVNDLISKIDAEIKRRNACGDNYMWDSYGFGTDNIIPVSTNPRIHATWECKQNIAISLSDGYYTCYYVDSSGQPIRVAKNDIYEDNTQFKVRKTNNQSLYQDVTPETLQAHGVLKPSYTIDMPQISSGTQATAEDINTLIDLLNAINTDTYWNTTTAVTAGNLIQTIIEISNTITNFDEDHTDAVLSSSAIQANKRKNIGSPPGNTSGCNSACKGLCLSCLGGSASNGGSSEGCTSGSSGGDECTTDCQWGCGGCGGNCVYYAG